MHVNAHTQPIQKSTQYRHGCPVEKKTRRKLIEFSWDKELCKLPDGFLVRRKQTQERKEIRGMEGALRPGILRLMVYATNGWIQKKSWLGKWGRAISVPKRWTIKGSGEVIYGVLSSTRSLFFVPLFFSCPAVLINLTTVSCLHLSQVPPGAFQETSAISAGVFCDVCAAMGERLRRVSAYYINIYIYSMYVSVCVWACCSAVTQLW